MDVINEYNLVKRMLINNSLPVVDGKLKKDNDGMYSKRLILDKKILLHLLTDL